MTESATPAPGDDIDTEVPVGDNHCLRVRKLPFTLVLPDEAAELFQVGTPTSGKSRRTGH